MMALWLCILSWDFLWRIWWYSWLDICIWSFGMELQVVGFKDSPLAGGYPGTECTQKDRAWNLAALQGLIARSLQTWRK
jgi:hypothetical protein